MTTPASDLDLALDSLTAPEVALHLRCSEQHVYDLWREGKLPCCRVGRLRRIRAATLARWIAEQEAQQAQEATRAGAGASQVGCAAPALAAERPLVRCDRERGRGADPGRGGSVLMPEFLTGFCVGWTLAFVAAGLIHWWVWRKR